MAAIPGPNSSQKLLRDPLLCGMLIVSITLRIVFVLAGIIGDGDTLFLNDRDVCCTVTCYIIPVIL